MFLFSRDEKIVLPKRQGPSILLVADGADGKFEASNKLGVSYSQGDLKRGTAIFLPAEDAIEITSKSDQITIFQAFC
jgi:hypothetical protein